MDGHKDGGLLGLTACLMYPLQNIVARNSIARIGNPVVYGLELKVAYIFNMRDYKTGGP